MDLTRKRQRRVERPVRALDARRGATAGVAW